MKFKIDENLPVECAKYLKSINYDAVTVIDQGLGGENDRILADICRNEKKTLITLDTDFSDIRSYPPKEYYGIIVLRIQNHNKNNIIKSLNKVVKHLKKNSPERQLWIVEEKQVRIRY